MRFKIPRYTERKSTIIGPATVTDLLYIAVAGFASTMFYFTLGHGFLFYLFSIIAFALAFTICFVKIKGDPIAQYIKKAVAFKTRPKEYLWERKVAPMQVSLPQKRKGAKKKGEEEEKSPAESFALKKKSRLQKIADDIQQF